MSAQSEFIARFSDLFAGRTDVYAVARAHRKPEKAAAGKLEYFPVEESLTPDVYTKHLSGKERIGVYPLVNDEVCWAAVDFDAPKDDDGLVISDAFTVAHEEARIQADAFQRAGLIPYLERSQSGQGCHLWIFFDRFVAAETVIRALKPLLVKAESYDRMYPVQKIATKKGYGNLIALPFHGESLKAGNSAFLDRLTDDVIPPTEFMAAVKRTPIEVIEELASKAPKERPALLPFDEPVAGEGRQLPVLSNSDWQGENGGRPAQPMRGWLKAMSAYGCGFLNHCWVNRKKLQEPEWYAMIGQTTAFKNGRAIAHLMSRDYPHYSPEEVDEKYNHALESPPMGCAAIREKFPHSGACRGCLGTAPYHQAKKSIIELVQETSEPMKKGGFTKAIDRIRRRNTGEEATGHTWGTLGLDEVTRLRRHEMTVFAAPPSIGKTAAMVDAMVTLAKKGVVVLAFSSETGESSLQDRILSHEADIDSKRLRGEGIPLNDAEYERLATASDALDKWPLFINYTATRADQVLDLIEDTLLTHQIPFDTHFVVFFDYLQFGAKTKEDQSEVDRLTRLSKEFKFIAKLTGGSLVLYSQLRRDAEGNEDVDMTMLKGSSGIEADADVIIFMTGERITGPIGRRMLHILKQREGQVGDQIPLVFHQTISTFEPDHLAKPKPDVFAESPEPFGSLF